MSRSGYTEDDYWEGAQWAFIRHRGAVASAIRGKRGQAFLRELISALDAMEPKELIPNELEIAGQFCTLGVVGEKRGVLLREIDPENCELVAERFNLSEALVREVMWLNDEAGDWNETPTARWERMRRWAERELKPGLQP